MEDKTCMFVRKCIPFNDFKHFTLSSKSFERQYSSIYLARLQALRDDIKEKATVKWGKVKQLFAPYQVISISDLAEVKEDKFHIIIGTLYKHQELKKAALYALATELQFCPQPMQSNYASFKDILFLEDETLRVKLIGNHVNVQSVVTGIVCAMLGRPRDNGTFWVEDWCFPGCHLSPSTSYVSIKSNGMVLLVSGLSLVNNTNSFGLNLLSEWIIGMAGCSSVQKEAACITRVIIAGNSVRGIIESFDRDGYSQKKKYDKTLADETEVAMHRLDEFLKSIVQCCCVTLMPGEFDPVCHTLPQQPLHPCLLPQTVRYKSFHNATNPWIGSIGSRIIAGSSGQPIQDIMKVAGLVENTPLIWLENTLYWRHYAPTAPDTLSLYPFFKSDPFVIKECPDIYFTGNMDKYDTKVIFDEGHTVKLICIPNFSNTQTAVLLDLESLETFPISFETNL